MVGIHQIELIFLLLLLFVVGFGTLAERLKTPYPIVLVVGGLLVSLIPGLPHASLPPDLIFLVMLPPLLFSAAFTTSWREFRRNILIIFLLAFGLVGFTALGVALAAHWLLPGFDWRLGLVLGAVISPTDAIAATSIARRLALPRRITDILEGESLVNDGSGLFALEFAVGIVVSGQTPDIGPATARLIYLVIAGILVGLLLGKLVYLFERWIDNAPVEITASIIAPYIAYFAGEAVGASGVLSVVACGLYLGGRSSCYFSSSVRIQAFATWRTLTFIFNGLAFLLIGLQLPYILAGIRSVGVQSLLFSAAIVVLFVILLRLAWAFPGASASSLVSRRLLKRADESISPRGIFIIGWTGMRGVVSLAAALAIPEVLENGKPFPQRGVIIFLTFCVIFVTLVLQGLTLPSLIRVLGLSQGNQRRPEEAKARRKIIRSALDELDHMRSNSDAAWDGVYDHIAEHYRARLAELERHDGQERTEGADPEAYPRYREATQKLRNVERSTALRLRDEGAIDDDVLRKVEHDLDLLDTRFPPRR